jgi:predicted  nucleic acid-binding Zn-ribbon protein
MPKSTLRTAPGQLALLLQLAGLDADIRRCERQLGHLVDAVDADRRSAEATVDRVRATIRDATATRETILDRLDSTLSERYRWLIEQGTQGFIVPVRDGRCAGCAAKLSASLIDGLSEPDTLGICSRCQRMLYGRGRDA